MPIAYADVSHPIGCVWTGYRSSGSVDTNVCGNLNDAKSAGVPYRDVYMFPCPVSVRTVLSRLPPPIFVVLTCASPDLLLFRWLPNEPARVVH